MIRGTVRVDACINVMLYVELVSRDFANSDEICRSCTIRSVNGTSDILLFSPFFSFSPTLLRISYVALKYRVDTVFSGRRIFTSRWNRFRSVPGFSRYLL